MTKLKNYRKAITQHASFGSKHFLENGDKKELKFEEE